MTHTSPSPIADYIAEFPPDVQAKLREMHRVIREATPEATEAIKYGIPTLVLGENLVHFAAFKNHIGFYPTSSPIRAFAEELRDFKTSKGAVQFPLNKPIPFDLVRRIVAFRVREAKERKAR